MMFLWVPEADHLFQQTLNRNKSCRSLNVCVTCNTARPGSASLSTFIRVGMVSSEEVERQMEKIDELPVDEMKVEELEIVSGGVGVLAWLTQKIHINYYNMNNFNDPTAGRYA